MAILMIVQSNAIIIKAAKPIEALLFIIQKTIQIPLTPLY